MLTWEVVDSERWFALLLRFHLHRLGTLFRMASS